MIISIPITDKNLCPTLVDEMLCLRKRVFKDILDWDVTIDSQGREIDQFDNIPGTYLVAVDEDFYIQASLRLLPTKGSYMAADVFQQLLEGNEPPRSAQIWESSRFFATPPEAAEQTRARRYWATQAHNKYIAMLLCGLGVYGNGAGLTDIVSVFDVAVERFLKSMGFACSRLGEPQVVGNTRAVAGSFDVDMIAVRKVANMWGFSLEQLVLNAGDARDAAFIHEKLAERRGLKMAV